MTVLLQPCWVTVLTIKDISACAICWENNILHSHPEIKISFTFIPKILMSKECVHFFGPLCIYVYMYVCIHTHVRVCACVYNFIYIYIYIYIHTHIYIYIYMCVCVCVNICRILYIYVCINNVFNAWRWSVWPKHVAYVDRTDEIGSGWWHYICQFLIWQSTMVWIQQKKYVLEFVTCV